MHNILLEIDGLDADWESQNLPISSPWEGQLEEVDLEGLSPYVIKLSTSVEFLARNYDTSEMGVESDVNKVDKRHPMDLDKNVGDSTLVKEVDGIRQVSHLGLGFFRS